MRKLFLIGAGAALLLGAATARAEYPSFEIKGFPVTWHQLNGVPTGEIRESPPRPATLHGMPVSPHQLAVLTPRMPMTQRQVVEKLMKAGFSKLRFVTPAEYTVMGLRDGGWVTLTVDSRTGELR